MDSLRGIYRVTASRFWTTFLICNPHGLTATFLRRGNTPIALARCTVYLELGTNKNKAAAFG